MIYCCSSGIIISGSDYAREMCTWNTIRVDNKIITASLQSLFQSPRQRTVNDEMYVAWIVLSLYSRGYVAEATHSLV